MQFEEAKSELADLREKYETSEREKRSLAEELEQSNVSMKELREKGTKVGAAPHKPLMSRVL